MKRHTAQTCRRLGCHDGRFLSRHHVCECKPQGGEVGREVGVVRDCPRCDTARLDAPRETTVSSHDIALEVLARLSERSTNGRLRDAIAQVRSELWNEVEGS